MKTPKKNRTFFQEIWLIMDYMCGVPENEKAESKAFKTIFKNIQSAYHKEDKRRETSVKPRGE